MTDLATIQQLSAAGRHQDCLQACQNALQASPEDASAYKYAGKSLLALGQFEKGQQFLLKAHELDTSNPEIVKDIGNIYLNLGNKDKALKWYQKALEINNNYAPALNNIANLKRQGGNHQQAIDLFKQAIQADPKLIQAYVGAAASFLALEDLDQAESFAAQALAINESTPAANEILGGVFQNKSNHDQAIECYQKELKIHPKASNSLLNLGLLFLQKGQTAASIYPLEKASALAPSEQCSLLLAQAYQNLGQFKEAIIEYKKLDINMSKNKIIPFNFGLCLLNTGNNIDAIKAFKIAIQLDELFIPAWGNVGIALTNEGKHREALPATQKVLKLDPNNLTALINLGEIYKVLGQLDQALAATLKSLELKPDNPDALINLGGIYKDLGQLDQALAATLKSLELKPDNPDVLINLGGIYKDLGQLDQALAATLKSLELKPDNPDALINLGGIYKDLGQLDQALAVTLKSLELKPDNPDALMNLGIIYKDLGNIDQALAVTLKSLELKPDNPDALINLGIIHKDLGNIDQALAVTLKSLELRPEESKSLCKLALIRMALGQTKEARRDLLISIERNNQECEAYHALSIMLETTEEAEEVIELIKLVKLTAITPHQRAFAEFAISNCFHKIKNHNEASKHLQLANKNKLIAFPSNADVLQRRIAVSISNSAPTAGKNIDTNSGKGRIFIVGMPRSGSTLLETILNMNPEIKDLGESRALKKAIAKMQQQEGIKTDHKNLDELYSQIEPMNGVRYKYTTDKNLYNLFNINWIAVHMPAAKIIHCRRNPLDNILSMHRSNLGAGNNYTANLKDSAEVLIAQEQCMQIQKRSHPEKIFTFDYDKFVNSPQDNLRRLLGWLDLEFEDHYLHPEKSTRRVNTASVMQARKPINNKSVGGWKNYENLLKPTLKILQERGLLIE